MAKRKLTIEEIEKRILNVHGNIVSLIRETYIGTSFKSSFIDCDYGKFEMLVYHVLNGKGHPIRGRKKSADSKRLSIQQIKDRLKQIYENNLTLDESTYTDVSTPCRFIDKDFPNDDWWITPDNIFRKKCTHPLKKQERTKQTNTKKYGCSCSLRNDKIKEKTLETNNKKYGCDNPQQNKDIALKTVRTANNSGIIPHWKTGEDCVWKGSYEESVLLDNNKKQVEYLWQPEVFKMPNGHTYRPDMYLIKENKWVEIKRI